ncbi:hypothetical protein GQX74_014960 [Glossina fuscipes]|nr:hypothetical protein GQX74_014960 [Glossina fuscipes]
MQNFSQLMKKKEQKKTDSNIKLNPSPINSNKHSDQRQIMGGSGAPFASFSETEEEEEFAIKPADDADVTDDCESKRRRFVFIVFGLVANLDAMVAATPPMNLCSSKDLKAV